MWKISRSFPFCCLAAPASAQRSAAKSESFHKRRMDHPCFDQNSSVQNRKRKTQTKRNTERDTFGAEFGRDLRL